MFFFNDTATTEIYTLSLHDALPIFPAARPPSWRGCQRPSSSPSSRLRRRAEARHDLRPDRQLRRAEGQRLARSEEHTSELQSRQYLVCRLLLEKKKPTPLR